MSITVKKAKFAYAEFDPDSPTLELQEGAALTASQESLEIFAELFNELSGSHWFCDVGEA